MKHQQTANDRRRPDGTFARAAALGLLALAAVLCQAREAAAQWTTSGTNTTTTDNVGVGTKAPASKLHVVDTDLTPDNELFVETTSGNYGPTLRLKSSIPGQAADFLLTATASSNAGGAGAFRIYDYAANATRFFIAPTTGNVGIGTTTPSQIFHVHSRGTYSGTRITTAATGGTLGDGVNFGYDDAVGAYVWNREASPLVFSTSNAEKMRVDAAGNVGIGTTAPAAKLDVQGDIRVSGNINARYQDVAEWVPSKQKLAAGTVVVLDTSELNHVRESAGAYDTGVAGVISAQPGIALGDKGEGKLLVATTGRVKVKVDATRGAIKVGDLLVTGDAAGVAMRSQPLELGGVPIHRPGTIIGKALEPLDKGVGEILVLLSLQ
jgi:hypothetical protein